MDTSSLIMQLSVFLAPYSANVTGKLCLEHSKALHYALNVNRPWAVKMWDSSARIQSGLITGDINSLGNFDECLAIGDVQLSKSTFSGKYCLPTIKLNNINDTDVMGNLLKEVMLEENDIKVGLGTLLSKGLRWAYCLPSSCTSEDLQVGLTDYLGPDSGVNVSVSDTDCHSVDIEFSAVDWFAIALLSLILFAVVLSTGYEFIKEYKNHGAYWNIPTPPSAVSSATTPDTSPPLYFPEDEPGPSGTGAGPSGTGAGSSGTGGGPSGTGAGPSGGTVAVREHPKLQRRPQSLPPGGHYLEPEDRSASLEFPRLSTITEETGSLDSPRWPIEERPRTLGSSGSLDAGVVPVLPSPPSNSPSQTSSETSPKEAQNQDDPESPERVELIIPGPAPPNETPGEQTVPNEEEGQVQPPPTLASSVQSAIETEYDPWAAFSILSNGEKLFAIKEPKRILPSLYGIKFISMCWVLLAQTCLIKESMPAMNYINIKTFFTQISAMPIMNVTLALDTFMVVTGVLVSYHFLRDMQKRGIHRRGSNNIRITGMSKQFFFSYYVVFFFHRLARMTPALATVVLLQVSLLRHLGSGPFWDSGTNDLAEVCRDNWWVTLTYLQNYVGGNRICLPQTWYLRVDMQLYTVAPFIFLFLLTWSRRRCLLLIISGISLALLICFLVNYFMEIPAGFMSGDPAKWPLKNVYDLQATYTRIPPWLVGIGVGYLLYYYRYKGKIEINIPTKLLVAGWILLPLCMVYAIFGLYPFQQPSHTPNTVLEAMYNSAFHTVWAFCIGWIILICESHHGGVVQAVLSWKIFQPLGRLSYCIFLIHLPLMSAQAFMTRMPIYITKNTAMSSFLGDLIYSTILAVILTLCVEMPFVRLYKILMMKLKFPVRRTNPPTYRTFGERLPALRDLALSAYRSISATALHKRTEGGSQSDSTGSSQMTIDTEVQSTVTRVAPSAERSEVATAPAQEAVLIQIEGATAV